MMLTRYDGRCGACDRTTKAGAGIYERGLVMCRRCAWDFASDDPRMAAGLTRLRYARPAAIAIPTFTVGDRAGHPSHRGGYDAIIIVASIHTDSNGTQHLSGPDTSGRATGLQGSLCKKLKNHTGDARLLAAWNERHETAAIQRREREETMRVAHHKMARDLAGGAR